MLTAALKRHRLRVSPDSAGILMRAAEFDQAEFVEGWRYEPLLPGFELPLDRLLALADEWQKSRPS